MTDSEIESRIAELKAEIDRLEVQRTMNYWYSPSEREKKSAAYRIAKQKAEANGEILKKYLLIGHFVKVTGSRSGNKFRKILKKNVYNFAGQHLETAKNLITGEIPMITEHSYSKITMVYHEGKWLKTKDFIEEINRLVA